MGSISGFVAILVILFVVLLFILWVILPFLIVGTNKRLNRLIDLLNENNRIQRDIKRDMERLAGEAEKSLNQNY